jgi:hypothetical protein
MLLFLKWVLEWGSVIDRSTASIIGFTFRNTFGLVLLLPEGLDGGGYCLP